MIKLSILPHVHVMTATCLPIGLTSLHVACVCACQNICICALCAHSHVFHKPVDVRHMHSKTDCHMYDMCVLAMMLGAVTIVQRNSVGEHVPPCCPSRFFSRCPSRCCVAAHACARAYGVCTLHQSGLNIKALAGPGPTVDGHCKHLHPT